MHLSWVSVVVVLLKLQQSCYWSADGSCTKEMFNCFLCNVLMVNKDKTSPFNAKRCTRFGFVACRYFRVFVLFSVSSVRSKCIFLCPPIVLIYCWLTYEGDVLLLFRKSFHLQVIELHNYCSGVLIEKLMCFSLRARSHFDKSISRHTQTQYDVVNKRL